jgi:serine protease Do
MATRKSTLFYALLIAVASLAVGMVIASRLDLSPQSGAQSLTIAPASTTPVTGPFGTETFRNIAKAQSPIVVNIRTESRQRTQDLTEFFGGNQDDLFRRFFGLPDGRQAPRPRDELAVAAGTGFIISKDGLILTNNHVVEGATKIVVSLFGADADQEYDAKVVGRDPLTDSALIELTEKPDTALPEAKLGDSALMQPGDWVMAIGNPFGLAHTISVGVISAVERPFPVAEQRSTQVLQTDAAINPGNSGGPLLNLRGEVVGINTAIYSGDRAGNIGIGFAIPINTVRALLPELRTGKVTRGRIGVQVQPVSRDLVEDLGLGQRRGALVASVVQGGPAARAGMEPGDVIVEFNGKPVADRDALVRMVVETRPGTSVPVKVVRDKQDRSLTVTIEELDLAAEGNRSADGQQNQGTETGFGMTLGNLTPEMARRLRMPDGTTGVVISDVDPTGSAARAGLQAGDVILEVNRQPTTSAAQASRELQRVESGRAAFFLIWRRGQEIFVTARKE